MDERMDVETIGGKGSDETNIVRFFKDNAGIQIFPDGENWEYTVGKVDNHGFSPVEASVFSSIKPWQSSKRLRN